MNATVGVMLACSGSGALEHTRQNIATSAVLAEVAVAFGFVAIAALAFRGHRRWWSLAATLVFAGLHPGWWFPTDGGDCGVMRVAFSSGATALCAALALSTWRKSKLVSAPPTRAP
jgi:hypothetical protein